MYIYVSVGEGEGRVGTFCSLNSAKCKCEFTNFAHEVTLRNNFAYLSRALICVGFYRDDDRSRYLYTNFHFKSDFNVCISHCASCK